MKYQCLVWHAKQKQMRWTVVGCVTCDCIHHHIRLICNSSIWFFLIFSFISFSLSPLDWWFAYSFHLPVLFRFPLSRFSSFKKQKHAFALPTINANCSRFDSSVPSSCANNGTGPTSTSILKRKYRWKAKNQGLFQVLRLADSSFVVFHSSPNPPKCLSQTPNCFFFSPLKHWTLWTGTRSIIEFLIFFLSFNWWSCFSFFCFSPSPIFSCLPTLTRVRIPLSKPIWFSKFWG